MLKIPFAAQDVARYAASYTDVDKDIAPMAAGEAARERGHLSREEFLTITLWKSARPKPHLQRNSEPAIHAATKRALLATDPTQCGLILSNDADGLDGVGIRVASAILHLCHREAFPLLDVRALDTLGIPLAATAKWGEHDFVKRWPEYVQVCREYCHEHGVPPRDLDRALWGYSKARAGQASRVSEPLHRGVRVRVPQWIRSGSYAIHVEVDAIIPDADPSEPCLEPATLLFLDELQRLADAGNVDELAKHGSVYVRRSE